MAHVREQIRDAVVSVVTGLSTTSSRVFVNRQTEITEDELPCLNVSTTSSEMVDEYSDYYRFNTYDLALTIEGFASGETNVDETLEDILAEVDTAIAADVQLEAALGGDKVWFCILESASMDELDEKSTPASTLTMEYRVRYRTSAGDPTTLIS
jgi:hypothetical protein|uniref:Uncharacterized protein n=1 Tax=uncultured marine virus TaxID=186617 RepID=A0A0F7L5V0_9VIRU|nr:hypothetical protein [uncultured marine virus]